MVENFNSRREFLKRISTVGAAGITMGALGTGCASGIKKAASVSLRNPVSMDSPVSFVTGKDHREAAFQALKPLKKEIEKAIGNKQVIIKVNMGQTKKELWLNATDADFTRGILDFLATFYDKTIIVAESTASGENKGTIAGFENYNFMPMLKEYNIRFADLNDEPSTTKFILDQNNHPLAIDIIDTYLDPNVYLISATRLKTHDTVIATLSYKNIVMGSPLHRYKLTSREKNQKPKMHSGASRGLSYNLFLLANMGVRPDLAVLDGVVGMEGDGPVWGTPIEQGVVLASADPLAADRLGVELMGIDYSEIKYLQWISAAGFGNDDLSKIKIIGPDYKPHIIKYKLHKNIERQRQWISEDYKS